MTSDKKNVPPVTSPPDKNQAKGKGAIETSTQSLTLMINNGRVIKPLYSASTINLTLSEVNKRFDAIVSGCIYESFKMGLAIPTFTVKSVNLPNADAQEATQYGTS